MLTRAAPKPDPVSPMSPAREPSRREAPCLRSPAMLGGARRAGTSRGAKGSKGVGGLERGLSQHHAEHSGSIRDVGMIL